MTRRSKSGTGHVVLGELLFLDRSTLTTKALRLFGTSGATVQIARRHVSQTCLTVRRYSPNSTASCVTDMSHRPELQSKQHGVMSHEVQNGVPRCATYAHSGSIVVFPSDRPWQLLLEHRYCRPSVAGVSLWKHHSRRCLTMEAPFLQAISRRCLTVEAPVLQVVSRRCLTVEAPLLQVVSRRCLTVEAPFLQAVSRQCLTVEAPLLQAVSRRCLTVEVPFLQAVSRRCLTVSDVSDWFYVWLWRHCTCLEFLTYKTSKWFWQPYLNKLVVRH
jgi:hypothetical protein